MQLDKNLVDVSSRGYQAGTTQLSAMKERQATSKNVVSINSSMFHNYSDIIVIVNVNRKNGELSQIVIN